MAIIPPPPHWAGPPPRWDGGGGPVIQGQQNSMSDVMRRLQTALQGAQSLGLFGGSPMSNLGFQAPLPPALGGQRQFGNGNSSGRFMGPPPRFDGGFNGTYGAPAPPRFNNDGRGLYY